MSVGVRAWGVLEVDAFSDQCHHSSPSRHSFSGSRFTDRCESSKGDGFVGWGQFGFLEARDVDFVLQHEVFEFAGLTMEAVAVPLQYLQLVLCLMRLDGLSFDVRYCGGLLGSLAGITIPVFLVRMLLAASCAACALVVEMFGALSTRCPRRSLIDSACTFLTFACGECVLVLP